MPHSGFLGIDYLKVSEIFRDSSETVPRRLREIVESLSNLSQILPGSFLDLLKPDHQHFTALTTTRHAMLPKFASKKVEHFFPLKKMALLPFLKILLLKSALSPQNFSVY